MRASFLSSLDFILINRERFAQQYQTLKYITVYRLAVSINFSLGRKDNKRENGKSILIIWPSVVTKL